MGELYERLHNDDDKELPDKMASVARSKARSKKSRKKYVKKIFNAVFRRKKHIVRLQSQPICVTNNISSSSSLARSVSMPREIKFLVNSAMSVYSAVSGASALPEPRGKSMMTSILPELVTDTESDFSILSQKTPGLSEDDVANCKLPPQLPSQSPPRSPCHSYKRSPFLTRTKYFGELVERSFIEMDTNNAGFVDRKELYSGLLLIHLNLSNYAGIFASKPPDCAEVYCIFDEIDVESNGLLNKAQYKDAARILSSQIVQRVAFHCSVVTMIIISGILQYLSLNVMHIIHSIYSIKFICYTVEGLMIICKDIFPYCAIKIYEYLYEALTGLYAFFNNISPVEDTRYILMMLIPGTTFGYILVNKHSTAVCGKKLSPSIIFKLFQ